MPTPLDTVLLPGFDGTGRLSRYFVDALPPQLTPSVIAYPSDVPESYSDLEARVRSLLPRDRAFAIVAEIVFGADRNPDRRQKAERTGGTRSRRHICSQSSSFCTDMDEVSRWKLFLSYLASGMDGSATCSGFDAPSELVSETLAAWCQVKPDVLAVRLREVLSVNAVDDFLAVTLPMLYVTGTQDRLLAPSTVDALQRLRPDLEVALIASPHFVLQRCPTEAADLIANFLARCTAVDSDRPDDRNPGTAGGSNFAKKHVS